MCLKSVPLASASKTLTSIYSPVIVKSSNNYIEKSIVVWKERIQERWERIQEWWERIQERWERIQEWWERIQERWERRHWKSSPSWKMVRHNRSLHCWQLMQFFSLHLLIEQCLYKNLYYIVIQMIMLQKSNNNIITIILTTLTNTPVFKFWSKESNPVTKIERKRLKEENIEGRKLATE